MNLKNKLWPNKWRNYLMSHRVAGHIFYTYKNLSHIHYARQFRFQVALKDAENTITREDLRACLALSLKAIESGEPIKAATYLRTMETYTDLLYSTETQFKIANPIILMDNEPEGSNNEEWTLKKRAAFDNSEEVKGFFLNTNENTLKAMQRLLSHIRIEDYLKNQEVQMIEAAFLNIIGRPKH